MKALIQAAEFLRKDDAASAERVLNEQYPFIPVKPYIRTYTIQQMMEQFFQDGFLDRYSGKRLIHPGLLRIMSEMLPDAFPYQAHWKMTECHIAFWEYQPTIDHIYPVALGGEDTSENWATTSMVNNSAKSNFTLEQLGWTLKERGDIRVWDGLSNLFLELVEKNRELLSIGRIKSYYVETQKAIDHLTL